MLTPKPPKNPAYTRPPRTVNTTVCSPNSSIVVTNMALSEAVAKGSQKDGQAAPKRPDDDKKEAKLEDFQEKQLRQECKHGIEMLRRMCLTLKIMFQGEVNAAFNWRGVFDDGVSWCTIEPETLKDLATDIAAKIQSQA
jgi:hypothetical protein